MADEGVKKVIVLEDNLPPVSLQRDGFVFRYRIISEDRNRNSHWSPLYVVGAPDTPESPFAADVVQPGALVPGNVSLIFEPDLEIVNNEIQEIVEEQEIDISFSGGKRSRNRRYDVYSNINNEGWKYVRTIQGTSFSTIIKPGTTSYRVAVQRRKFPRRYEALLQERHTVFESGELIGQES